jgi:hypothetical protein
MFMVLTKPMSKKPCPEDAWQLERASSHPAMAQARGPLSRFLQLAQNCAKIGFSALQLLHSSMTVSAPKMLVLFFWRFSVTSLVYSRPL